MWEFARRLKILTRTNRMTGHSAFRFILKKTSLKLFPWLKQVLTQIMPNILVVTPEKVNKIPVTIVGHLKRMET